jgi:hypothetical protein
LPSQGPRVCSIWPCAKKNYAMIMAKPSSFDIKAMQPRTW